MSHLLVNAGENLSEELSDFSRLKFMVKNIAEAEKRRVYKDC